MVHLDINPVEVSYNWETRKERRLYSNSKVLDDVSYQQLSVSVYGVIVFTGPWERHQYGNDDYVEREWRDKWETFLGESFRAWIATNNLPDV